MQQLVGRGTVVGQFGTGFEAGHVEYDLVLSDYAPTEYHYAMPQFWSILDTFLFHYATRHLLSNANGIYLFYNEPLNLY